jgi:hypothetical protein
MMEQSCEEAAFNFTREALEGIKLVLIANYNNFDMGRRKE